jgi:hypothetical protein
MLDRITLLQVRIGVLKLSSTIGDYDANRIKLVAAYEKACQSSCSFAVILLAICCCALILLKPVCTLLLKPLKGPIPLCVGYVDKNPNRSSTAPPLTSPFVE